MTPIIQSKLRKYLKKVEENLSISKFYGWNNSINEELRRLTLKALLETQIKDFDRG